MKWLLILYLFGHPPVVLDEFDDEEICYAQAQVEVMKRTPGVAAVSCELVYEIAL